MIDPLPSDAQVQSKGELSQIIEVAENVTEPRLWSPKRLIIQGLGFAVGLVLLVWCIHGAVQGGDWSRIREANPLLVVGLMVCSLTSLIVNGAVFWTVIRPVQHLRLVDMVRLNFCASVLNYAPIRLGFIARLAYAVRVDHMPLLRIGGWFSAIAFSMFLCLGAVTVATIIHPQIDWIWALILIAQLIVGGLLMQAAMAQAVITRYGRGMHVMLSHPTAMWGAIGLRLVDEAAFVGRMACAVGIMQLNLSAHDIVLLGIATLALTMNPLGRFGWREAGVALVAQRLVSADLSSADLEDQMKQLALIDSAGEALVAIPIGAVMLLWYRARWRQASQQRDASHVQIVDAK